MLFMVKMLLDRKERESLCQLFEALDENQDSHIELGDLSRLYKDKFSIIVTEADFDRSYKHLNLSRPGGMTLTEFLIGACNKSSLITEGSVKQVF